MSSFDVGSLTAVLSKLRCPCGNRTDWGRVRFGDGLVTAECTACGRVVEMDVEDDE